MAAVHGVAGLTGAPYFGRNAEPPPGCPSGATKCFFIESEIDGVRSAYFHGWLATAQFGSLCYVYTVEDGSGWRFLDMTCSRPESGGPSAPDVGQFDVVVNTAGSCANVRQAAGLGSRVIGCLRSGTNVTVDGGPVYVVETTPGQSHLWWHLSGKGWMAHDFLFVAWIPAT